MARILLIGGDADYNIGDAAIQHSVCAALLAADPSVRITVVSARPELPPPRGVIDVLPKGGRHAVAQWAAARRQDMIVVGGGGLFQDDDSRIKMPYWAARLAALRTACPVIAGHCLGAGPLSHAESRALARLACSTFRSVSVRDEIARRTLQACTARPVSLVPDPAFMLEPAPAGHARRHLETLGCRPGRPLIGVVLRRWFYQRGGFMPHRVRVRLGLDANDGQERMRSLITELAAALSGLARTLDAGILIMPSYLAAHEGDRAACEALALRITGTDVHVAHMDSPGLYKAVAGELALLISARMHPLILAAGMGTPVLGIGYNSKFAGSMDLLGIPGQLLWFDELEPGTVGGRVAQRALDALHAGAPLAERAAALGAQTREAAGRLLELLS